MNARHCDDALGRVELALAQWRARVETLDGLTRTHASPQVLLRDFGIEVAHVEGRKLMLFSKLLDDPHVKIDPAVRPRVAGRADDHRHPDLTGGEEHLLQVVSLPSERTGGRVGAERNRTDIIATRIG